MECVELNPRFPEWRVLRGHWFQSAGKPTHSNTERVERKPFWGFAPNEPIFRFRSIRRVAVAVSDATTESGVCSVEILKQGYVSTRGPSPKGRQNPLAHPNELVEMNSGYE